MEDSSGEIKIKRLTEFMEQTKSFLGGCHGDISVQVSVLDHSMQRCVQPVSI